MFKQHVNLLEDNEKELAKKSVCNLKIIRMLTDKCRIQEEVISELDEKLNEMGDALNTSKNTNVDLELKM